MTNKEWYYYDEIKKKYVLTDKAPLKAIHSYKHFEMEQKLVQMLSYGEVDDEIEAELFNLYDKRNVGDHIYVLFPVAALTTKDLYGLLLTVNKQKRKQS